MRLEQRVFCERPKTGRYKPPSRLTSEDDRPWAACASDGAMDIMYGFGAYRGGSLLPG